MRNTSYYLALLALVLFAGTVLVPLSVVGRVIMIVVVALTIVLTGTGVYLDHAKVSPSKLLLVMAISIAGLVFSIIVGITSLLWAPAALSGARASSGDETEASLMLGVVLVSCFFALCYGLIFSDCRRKQTSEQDKIVRG